MILLPAEWLIMHSREIIDSFKRVILNQNAVIELFIIREKVDGSNTQINHILRRNPAITRYIRNHLIRVVSSNKKSFFGSVVRAMRGLKVWVM